MDRLRRLLAIVTAAATIAAAAPAGAAEAPGLRIVSLAPHITELLYAAGAGRFVVGATEYSDFPEAARALPRIGDSFRLDYEGIVALRPDFALAWQSGTPQAAISRLEALGVRVVALRVQALDEIPAAIEEIGRLTGTGAAAGPAADRLRRDLAGLRAGHAGLRLVRVFVELDHEPLFTVTGRHPISEMVELCGGVNVFDSLPGLAPVVDLESVVAARPEAILYTGPDTNPARWWSAWPQIPAVATGAILRVPSDVVSRSTPRVVEGVRAVCEAIDVARRAPGAGTAKAGGGS